MDLSEPQMRQRQLEESYPAGHYTTHKATGRRYFIVDNDEDGCHLIQAVRGVDSSAMNAPQMTRSWDEMRSFYEVPRP